VVRDSFWSNVWIGGVSFSVRFSRLFELSDRYLASVPKTIEVVINIVPHGLY
jgi:hypothetical protein